MISGAYWQGLDKEGSLIKILIIDSGFLTLFMNHLENLTFLCQNPERMSPVYVTLHVIFAKFPALLELYFIDSESLIAENMTNRLAKCATQGNPEGWAWRRGMNLNYVQDAAEQIRSVAPENRAAVPRVT